MGVVVLSIAEAGGTLFSGDERTVPLAVGKPNEEEVAPVKDCSEILWGNPGMGTKPCRKWSDRVVAYSVVRRREARRVAQNKFLRS